FYAPNILQTLLIVLRWPISFFFVKSCVFILVLSLTRNMSYFTDEVPKDFLATSTTFTQWHFQYWLSDIRGPVDENQKDDEIKKLIEIMRNNNEIRELIKMIIKDDENQNDETQKDEKDIIIVE